jgi:TP901 family phage tail tape measure protein
MAASAGAIRAGSAYVEIFARDGQFQQSMSRIRARMMTLGTQLRQAGTSMTIGGAALGAPFVFAARTAAAFSLEMARVRANTGATDQQFASLNSSAKAMAVQFGRSPEEVAGAMSELAKAGLDAEGVLKSISPILAVAAADNMELSRAVEVAVSTMAQFGMTTNDFGTIADKLQATANASTTSVDSIGEALSYVGPKAQEAGQSFDDVAAAIATLADAGLRGSLGGTGLARVIESIANEEEKLAGLGVSTRDAAGGMRPFIDVLEDLGKKTANMSNVDRIRLFTDIFEIRGANAAMSLSNMRDKFNEVLGTIQNSGGTALNKATAVMGSFGGAVAQLGAQFGVFQIQVIESMGPMATQAVQAFTRMMAVVGEFISRNGTLVAIVAGSAAALFGLGVATLAAGIALQGLATGLRVIQAVLPLIPALFSPIGLSIAAMGAAIAGGVVIARTLSPAFREETDAIGAALMRLDFGAAWSVMNINLAIALVQMHQAFAQAFDFVKNTVIATSQFIGDMLIQGLDRFMGLFGEDILTLQSGFEKLGVYFRAAFDWDFAVNGMSDALKKVEARVEEARQRAPTADARAEQRKQEREKAAEGRNEEIKRRDAGFEDTIKELRKDAARARERALGETEPKPAETVDEKGQPIKPKLPAAPPGAFMPPPEGEKGNKDKGISSAGSFSGVGLDIGPELASLDNDTKRTADATEATAEATRQLAARGQVVSDLYDGQRGQLVARAEELQGVMGLNGLGDTEAERQRKAAELEQVQSDLAALDAFRAVRNTAGPAVAMEALAPRAMAVQGAADQGMQAAMTASQTGIDFRQVGSEIVAAVNAGTEVSKSMLSVLNRIADKSSPELSFT